MSELHEEILAIADRLERFSEQAGSSDVKELLGRLEEAAKTIGKAWSGSWLGYQARIYYHNLQRPPPGAHFSQVWGRGTTEEWQEFDGDEVEQAIHQLAGNPDLSSARQLANQAQHAFEDDKLEMISLLTTAITEQHDSFLTRLKEEVDTIKPLTRSDVIQGLQPSGQVMTTDTLALAQGFHIPPHISVLSEVIALRQPPEACGKLAHVARKAGSHLARNQRQLRRIREIGTNVFIGHGRSPLWKDLKDFIQDRLALLWDEFNRVPIAGITNIARLSEMLDAAAIAFLVMTGEDEQADGELHARMNVVHEAGLFQGRLGFTRAIVLLEDGCEEFSNIQGLGQIRFPKGNIKAAFEEIRQVLEREGLL